MEGKLLGTCEVKIDQILGLPKKYQETVSAELSANGKDVQFERKLSSAEGIPSAALAKLEEVLTLFVNGPQDFVLNELTFQNYEFQPNQESTKLTGYFMYTFVLQKNGAGAEIKYTNSLGQDGDTSFITQQTITKTAHGLNTHSETTQDASAVEGKTIIDCQF